MGSRLGKSLRSRSSKKNILSLLQHKFVFHKENISRNAQTLPSEREVFYPVIFSCFSPVKNKICFGPLVEQSASRRGAPHNTYFFGLAHIRDGIEPGPNPKARLGF